MKPLKTTRTENPSPNLMASDGQSTRRIPSLRRYGIVAAGTHLQSLRPKNHGEWFQSGSSTQTEFYSLDDLRDAPRTVLYTGMLTAAGQYSGTLHAITVLRLPAKPNSFLLESRSSVVYRHTAGNSVWFKLSETDDVYHRSRSE
jgi:hypothetical protein